MLSAFFTVGNKLINVANFTHYNVATLTQRIYLMLQYMERQCLAVRHHMASFWGLPYGTLIRALCDWWKRWCAAVRRINVMKSSESGEEHLCAEARR